MTENPDDMKSEHPASLTITASSPGVLCLRLSGEWRMGYPLPSAEAIRKHLDPGSHIQRIEFDATELAGWDSGLLSFLAKVERCCTESGAAMAAGGLPEGVRRLLALASATPRKETRNRTDHPDILTRIGRSVLVSFRASEEFFAFLGEVTLAFGRLATGRARWRFSDLALFVQRSGPQALPIVSLISLLVGLILAFVGAVQLKLFGAQIYIADLVGLGMVREMGAMMTGVIMAGRTGAAYAAQLGTMQVNEEIDALKTLSISPMDFLVIPRVIAITLMMPFLCVYSDFIGMLGGMAVGIGMFDITYAQYVSQTRAAVTLTDLWIGIFKSSVFGVLVALSGCLRGIQCGRSADAVGTAATSAVVTAIVWIVVADALITVITSVIGI